MSKYEWQSNSFQVNGFFTSINLTKTKSCPRTFHASAFALVGFSHGPILRKKSENTCSTDGGKTNAMLCISTCACAIFICTFRIISLDAYVQTTENCEVKFNSSNSMLMLLIKLVYTHQMQNTFVIDWKIYQKFIGPRPSTLKIESSSHYIRINIFTFPLWGQQLLKQNKSNGFSFFCTNKDK